MCRVCSAAEKTAAGGGVFGRDSVPNFQQIASQPVENDGCVVSYQNLQRSQKRQRFQWLQRLQRKERQAEELDHSYALTPNTVELIPTRGALSPEAGATRTRSSQPWRRGAARSACVPRSIPQQLLIQTARLAPMLPQRVQMAPTISIAPTPSNGCGLISP